jgi:phosphoribosylformylglycinamidine synthase subunit PurS
MEFIAQVDVMLKEGISDPQGQTIERALPALGYSSIGNVRVGKHISLRIEADDEDAAREKVAGLCDVLLANPVIESYSVQLGED